MLAEKDLEAGAFGHEAGSPPNVGKDGGTSRNSESEANPVTGEAGKTSNYDHPSTKLWAVYAAEAAKYDKALIESWTKDMDGILIFSGLFSAIVSAFLVDSYKNLSPNTSGTTYTNALLAQISLQLAAGSNGSHVGPLSSPDAFEPTSSALLVNAVWFLSLILGLTCALAATLVQQWAREYQQAIDRRSAPHKKALIRSFLYEGVTNFKMTAVVEVIPTLLHVAVMLFFVGLIDFLFSFNKIIAEIIFVFVGVAVLLYVGITFLPIFRLHCPYKTPFSTLLWPLVQSISVLKLSTYRRHFHVYRNMAEHREIIAVYPKRLNYKDHVKRALRWTIQTLREDSEVETFLAALPDILSAPEVDSFFASDEKFSTLVVAEVFVEVILERVGHPFLRRTAKLLETCLAPTSLTDGPRSKRVATCLHAITGLYQHSGSDDRRSSSRVSQITARLESSHFFRTLRALRNDRHPAIAFSACSITEAIAGQLEAAMTRAAHGDSKLTFVEYLAVIRALYSLERFAFLTALIGGELSPPRVLQVLKLYQWDLLNDQLKDFIEGPSRPSVDKHKYIGAWLKFICSTVALSQASTSFFTDIPALLVKMRNSQPPALAQYANCASARVVVCFQRDLLNEDTKWYLVYDLHGALSILGSLDAAADGSVNRDLLSQVTCGYLPPPIGATFQERRNAATRFREWLNAEFQPLDDMDAHIPQDERKQLEELQVVDQFGNSVETGYRGRILIHRGRTAILVVFLHSMKDNHLPEETLKLTLETLQFLTTNLTARYSSASVQSLFVQLAAQTAKGLHTHFMLRSGDAQRQEPGSLGCVGGAGAEGRKASTVALVDPPSSHVDSTGASVGDPLPAIDYTEPKDYILPMVQALLDVIGTVAHPTSIADAKRVAQTIRDDYAEFGAVHADAVSTLRKLETKVPFEVDASLFECPEVDPAVDPT